MASVPWSTTRERAMPRAMTGRAARKPASGPASPTSKRDFFEENGERILMKAPKVPIRVGAGMK